MFHCLTAGERKQRILRGETWVCVTESCVLEGKKHRYFVCSALWWHVWGFHRSRKTVSGKTVCRKQKGAEKEGEMVEKIKSGDV